MGQIKKMPRSLREFDIIYSNLGNEVNKKKKHREQGLVLRELVWINKSVRGNLWSSQIVHRFIGLKLKNNHIWET